MPTLENWTVDNASCQPVGPSRHCSHNNINKWPRPRAMLSCPRAVRLWPWPTTSKSNQFIAVLRCTRVVYFTKFSQAGYKTLCSQTFGMQAQADTQTHAHIQTTHKHNASSDILMVTQA